jgi:hypothetical protein
MAEQTDTRRIGEIVEAEIGSVAYTALHVSDVQAAAENLAEALTDDDRAPAEFVELLRAVAAYEVRL